MSKVKTREFIKSQKEVLFRTHPKLDQYNLVRVKDAVTEQPFEKLANIIETAWTDTYKKRSRFEYSKSYLEWVFGTKGLNSDLSIVAKKNNEIVGIFLFTPRTFISNGRTLSTGIQSALSVIPEEKGNGLAKLLHLQVQEYAQSEIEGHVYWYDNSLKGNNKSHQIFQALEKDFFHPCGKYELKARIFDSNRALSNHTFKFYEKPIVKLFSSSPSEKVTKSCGIIQTENVDECLDYVNKNTVKNGIGRLFSRKEFEKYATFSDSDSGFKAMGIYQRVKGKIEGLAIGYTLKTIGVTEDQIFFLDMIHLPKKKNLQSLLRGIETIAYRETNSFGMITPDPRPGFANRYIPSGSNLSCYLLKYSNQFEGMQHTKKLLIDHK